MAWKTSARIKSPKRHQARPVGGVQALRHRRDQAEPLQRGGEDPLGQPRQPAVRVAHPAPGRVRRLRARGRRLPRLDPLRRAPVHDPPQPPAGEHDGPARRRPSGRRGAAPAAEGQGAPRPRAPRPPDGPAAGRAGVHPRELGRGPRSARRPDPRHAPRPPRGLPHRPGHHQRDLLRGAEVHPVPRQQQHRQRGTGLPCAVDDHAEEDDRRRRDHVLLHRRHRQRPHRAVRRQRRQRPAGVHEVPLPGAQARREGRGGEPVAGARARPLLGAQQRRERDVRHAHDRRVLRGAHRR